MKPKQHYSLKGRRREEEEANAGFVLDLLQMYFLKKQGVQIIVCLCSEKSWNLYLWYLIFYWYKDAPVVEKKDHSLLLM